MPRPSRREDMLNAALSLLARRGFVGLSARDIAKETGVAAASLYNHFATLEDLIAEVLRRATTELAKDYHLLFEQELPARVKMKTLTFLTVARYQRDPTMVRILHHALAEHNDRALQIIGEHYNQALYPKHMALIRAVAPKADPSLIHFLILSLATGSALYLPAERNNRALPSWGKSALRLTETILRFAIPNINWSRVDCLKVIEGQLVLPARGRVPQGPRGG